MMNKIFDFYQSLSKLFATENIGFVIDPSLSTACFDLHNRVLYMPMWDMNNTNLYCFVIAHEVGHALWTPYDKLWMDENAKAMKCIVNIVEDYRIDNMIKSKFPGVIEDYKIGIQYLYNNNFFGEHEIINEKIKDTSPKTFLDRLCLYLKVKANIQFSNISFSEEEKALVREVIRASSFEDVKVVSQKIFDYLKDNLPTGDGQDPDNVDQQGTGGIKSEIQSTLDKNLADSCNANRNYGNFIKEPDHVKILNENDLYENPYVKTMLMDGYGKYK